MFEQFSSFFVQNYIILTAVLAFALGTWVYFDRRGDDRNITLGGLLVAVAIWSFALVLWRTAPAGWQSLFWLRSLFFIGSILPVIYLLFAHTYLHERHPRSWVETLLLLPTLALGWVAYGTDQLVRSGPGGSALFGTGRVIFAVHFVVYSVAALAIFIRATRRNKLLDRSKTISVLVGTILSFDVIFGVLYGSRPAADAGFLWVGNAALLLGMFIIAVSVLRRRLIVDLRLVSVDFFVLAVLLIAVADIAAAGDPLGLSVRLVILLVLVFYGVLTSRNLVREVRHLREIEAMNEHITQMNGRLLEADRSKTRFVSLASHQFRSPLGGIRSYLDMLLAGDFGPLSQRQKEVIGLNLGVCGQLMETIETFLSASKIELGKLELYKAETSLPDLVDRVIAGIRPLADKKGLELVSEVPASLRPICCDAGKMYHVLMNLIDNAIKYTPRGRVTVRAALAGDQVEVRVTDTGIGLEPEAVGRLFEAFERGLAGITLNKDGSGLGLFIIKNIVEAHGGRVIVESPGKDLGSTFGFTLPLAAVPSASAAPFLTQK